MRVLFVSWKDLAHPRAGGAEYVTDRLATGLQTRGHEVALLAGGPVGDREYPVIDAGGTYSQYLRAPLQYRKRFRDWDVVVDVENGVPFFSPVWRKGPVVCLVHHVHVDQWSMYFAPPVAATGRALEARVMPRVYRDQLFVAVSKSTADSLVGLGIPAASIRTIEMGCDPAPAPVSKSETPLFLALGRLVAHKRVDRLLTIWEQVRPHTGGRLLVVGDGPDAQRLREQAGADVELLGSLSQADKQQLLGEAWLLVHAAHHEGWGTVIMEAAAAGTPTVAFDVRGVRDSVVDGETGVLADDDDAFAAAWIRLANDPDERRRLSEAARQRAGEFTWDRAVTAFEAVVREATAR
jgi:glycosyltransferase involved in cell wall biosynthesis